MANKQRGEVTVELDRTRVLKYDLNALEAIEEKLGVELKDMDKVKMGIKNIKAILWAGLIHEDEDLTERQVGAMVDVTNLEEVQEKVSEAFSMAKNA